MMVTLFFKLMILFGMARTATQRVTAVSATDLPTLSRTLEHLSQWII